MFIIRTLQDKILQLKGQFPVLAILGPRQTGKTTLAKHVFPNHHYVNLEELDVRQFAIEDPRGFLELHSKKEGVILDEIQNTPDLFTYLQAKVDANPKPGFYVLTGSQNILLSQQIGQTLAGRITIQTLLPLSIEEIDRAHKLPQTASEFLFKGGYPSIYTHKVDPNDWYKGYIQTYVERDVRQIRNITDLSLFQKFIKLCAGRIGQLLNMNSLSDDCGVSVNTIKAWLSILEASYILFLLQPHHKNFSKRLIKAPKLYFYDSGLAARLLGIETPEMLAQHYQRGGLFEAMVLSDLLKTRYNRGKLPNLYFWRDKSGLEIDCLIEEANKLIPIEIKSAQTVHPDFFASLSRFCEVANLPPGSGKVVYAGSEEQKRTSGHVLSWKHKFY